MDFFAVLNMVLGLALFLYGMNVMGESLSKIAGGRLEKILERLTSSPVKGVLLGASVTAVIQSSSATTVMVVGFVNSGIMKLSQAVYIIMGANVGTTITSWLLSLAGISGENFFLKLLKPENFSPILGAAGIILILFVKNRKKQDIGSILMGFTILMVGMHTMSSAVEPLASMPGFAGILTAFSNPVLGIIAGAVFTAAIQSSSAAVGILQALCLSGAVTYGAALPIIMGQNIGTCVTALLSSVGANKNARRAAMVHLYFNLTGTILFVAGFYTANHFVHFEFLSEGASIFGIALVHTGFNIIATAVLLPFGKVLEKLAIITIPDKEGDIEVIPLVDMRFMETPGIAVEECYRAARKMARSSRDAVNLSFDLLDDFSNEKMEKVIELEQMGDRYEDELGSYLVKLSKKDLSDHDSHSVSIMLYCLSDFERISDYSLHIMKAAEELQEKEMSFSEGAVVELRHYLRAVRDIVDMTYNVFSTEDRELAKEIEPLEEAIDIMEFDIKGRHINRLKEGSCTIEKGFVLADLMTSLERIADHCSNIAACILEVREDGYDTHGYMEELKRDSSESFREAVERNMKKYSAK